jgi:hypothetical protein
MLHPKVILDISSSYVIKAMDLLLDNYQPPQRIVINAPQEVPTIAL